MVENNSHNLLYFEAPSMRELYEVMDCWQKGKNKRLLSISIEKDDCLFCCIALTNPTEVLIVDGRRYSSDKAGVDAGQLLVKNYGRTPDY